MIRDRETIFKCIRISPKRWEMDMWLLSNINRNSYMESPTAPLDLSLGDLERSKSRSPRFQSFISRNGAMLGPMLLLTINRKSYMVSPMTPWHLNLNDLERSKSRSFRFWVAADVYCIHIFASSLLPPSSGCHQREFVGGQGFLLSQQSFLFFFCFFCFDF